MWQGEGERASISSKNVLTISMSLVVIFFSHHLTEFSQFYYISNFTQGTSNHFPIVTWLGTGRSGVWNQYPILRFHTSLPPFWIILIYTKFSPSFNSPHLFTIRGLSRRERGCHFPFHSVLWEPLIQPQTEKIPSPLFWNGCKASLLEWLLCVLKNFYSLKMSYWNTKTP